LNRRLEDSRVTLHLTLPLPSTRRGVPPPRPRTSVPIPAVPFAECGWTAAPQRKRAGPRPALVDPRGPGLAAGDRTGEGCGAPQASWPVTRPPPSPAPWRLQRTPAFGSAEACPCAHGCRPTAFQAVAVSGKRQPALTTCCGWKVCRLRRPARLPGSGRGQTARRWAVSTSCHCQRHRCRCRLRPTRTSQAKQPHRQTSKDRLSTRQRPPLVPTVSNAPAPAESASATTVSQPRSCVQESSPGLHSDHLSYHPNGTEPLHVGLDSQACRRRLDLRTLSGEPSTYRCNQGCCPLLTWMGQPPRPAPKHWENDAHPGADPVGAAGRPGIALDSHRLVRRKLCHPASRGAGCAGARTLRPSSQCNRHR